MIQSRGEPTNSVITAIPNFGNKVCNGLLHLISSRVDLRRRYTLLENSRHRLLLGFLRPHSFLMAAHSCYTKKCFAQKAAYPGIPNRRKERTSERAAALTPYCAQSKIVPNQKLASNGCSSIRHCFVTRTAYGGPVGT